MTRLWLPLLLAIGAHAAEDPADPVEPLADLPSFQIPGAEPADPLEPSPADAADAAVGTRAAAARIADRLARRIAERIPLGSAAGAWLAADDRRRLDWWLTLDPADDADRAAALLDRLVAADPTAADRLPRLLIATALVWDRPVHATMAGRFAVYPATLPDPPDPLDHWRWLADPAVVRDAGWRGDRWPVPAAMLVTDIDLPVADRGPLLRRFAQQRWDPAGIYDKIPYDAARSRGGGRILERTYGIDALLDAGGVCGDRAWAASRLAKLFGMPAAVAGGRCSHGLGGHAWTVTFSARGAATVGRHELDGLWRSAVVDPQTGRGTTAGEVQRRIAAALADADAARDADAVARLAAGSDATAAALAALAVTVDPRCADGWAALWRCAAAGHRPPGRMDTWSASAAAALGQHPDAVARIVPDLVTATATGAKQDPAWAAWWPRLAGRPDLAVAVRLAQVRDLEVQGRGADAVAAAVEGMVRHAEAGLEVAPLAAWLMDEAPPVRNAGALVARLRDALPRVPDRRQRAPAPARRIIAGWIDRIATRLAGGSP